jgi:predicted nucleic acid-binding Zn ribbon protein
MIVLDCVKCGEKTTNGRTKTCDTCKTKEILRKQKEREK